VGTLGTAVRASSSVPAVFQPVTIGGREYVDGGLVSPVPVRYARQMGAELVLAVDISVPPDGNATSDTMKLLLQTFAIMGRSINQFELRRPTWWCARPLVGLSSADFTSRVRAIRAGREAAPALLPELKARIAALTRCAQVRSRKPANKAARSWTGPKKHPKGAEEEPSTREPREIGPGPW
jgi:NTE family protein